MKRLVLGLACSMVAGVAIADEVPAGKAPLETSMSADGWYFSADGAWQSVKLPAYSLGFRRVAEPLFPDAGAFQTFNRHIDGYMVRGAAGYFLPPAWSDTLFGANTRVEIGGLYGHASGSASGTAVYTGGGVVTQTLDGAGANGGYVCADFQHCTTNSNLSTSYSNWQFNGKIAGEYSIAAISVAPSLAIFGGKARVNQTLAQTIQIGVAATTPTYDASTSLRWRDVGARAGLDLKFEVIPRVEVGLGGWAGFAGRRASLDGTDLAVDHVVGLMAGDSAISSSANATPFLANAEAGVAFKWLPALTVRGFTGLNYDSKTPGIASSSFTGGIGGGITSRTPAHITFHAETSFYAGGGITWTF